jgi:hypothetical protein
MQCNAVQCSAVQAQAQAQAQANVGKQGRALSTHNVGRHSDRRAGTHGTVKTKRAQRLSSLTLTPQHTTKHHKTQHNTTQHNKAQHKTR